MSSASKTKHIAILASDGFEPSELSEPRRLLEQAGLRTTVIAPDHTQAPGRIRGWHQQDWGESVDVDLPLAQARAEDFDALLLPGGQKNADRLRQEPQAIAFIHAFGEARKAVAAICHGPAMLIDAGLVGGMRLTSGPSLQMDLRNAGAEWVDLPVVMDGYLVTSRMPGDIPDFVRGLLNVLGVPTLAEAD